MNTVKAWWIWDVFYLRVQAACNETGEAIRLSTYACKQLAISFCFVACLESESRASGPTNTGSVAFSLLIPTPISTTRPTQTQDEEDRGIQDTDGHSGRDTSATPLHDLLRPLRRDESFQVNSLTRNRNGPSECGLRVSAGYQGSSNIPGGRHRYMMRHSSTLKLRARYPCNDGPQGLLLAAWK